MTATAKHAGFAVKHQCGSCTMCCKLLIVKELEKPVNKWCVHCKPGKGCTIYGSHPPSCKDFECVWLQMPELSDELRPDKSKCVLTNSPDGKLVTCLVDPGFPLAWQESKILRILENIAEQGILVAITLGIAKTTVLYRLEKGKVGRKTIMMEKDEDGKFFATYRQLYGDTFSMEKGLGVL